MRFLRACAPGAILALVSSSCIGLDDRTFRGVGTADAEGMDAAFADAGTPDSGRPAREDDGEAPGADASIEGAVDAGTSSDGLPGSAAEQKESTLGPTEGGYDVASDENRADAASADDSAGNPACDETRRPVEDACVIRDDLAVFVSPAGNDTLGTGTRALPFRTMARGILAAVAGQKRVYVCGTSGAYDEQVDVTQTVSIFGGFDCASWQYAAANAALLRPSSAGTAVVIRGNGVLLEDIRIEARDANDPGESSVAVLAAQVSDLRMRRVTLLSGRGANGSTPAVVSNYDPVVTSARMALDGANANAAAAGPARSCSALCANGEYSTGGQGGEAPNGAPQPGFPSWPTSGAADGGAGSTSANCSSGGTGHDGALAPASAGGLGASSWGTLDADGWKPSSGLAGATGHPGQGGGGGRWGSVSMSSGGLGSVIRYGGGGGGACGGCGGSGGPGGTGGGSSFALLAYRSTITLESCTLTAGHGGLGGNGAAGQAGQAGGKGGSPGYSNAGCSGGNGGGGAQGGGGGGGAGGHSAAVAYVGAQPIADAATQLLFGEFGVGGQPGGGGLPSTKGVDGKAEQLLKLVDQ